MASTQANSRYVDEISDLLSSVPTREQLLNFRPSQEVQARAQDLLARQNAGQLTYDEKIELDELLHTEMLMRLVKAKLRTKSSSSP